MSTLATGSIPAALIKKALNRMVVYEPSYYKNSSYLLRLREGWWLFVLIITPRKASKWGRSSRSLRERCSDPIDPVVSANRRISLCANPA